MEKWRVKHGLRARLKWFAVVTTLCASCGAPDYVELHLNGGSARSTFDAPFSELGFDTESVGVGLTLGYFARGSLSLGAPVERTLSETLPAQPTATGAPFPAAVREAEEDPTTPEGEIVVSGSWGEVEIPRNVWYVLGGACILGLFYAIRAGALDKYIPNTKRRG